MANYKKSYGDKPERKNDRYNKKDKHDNKYDRKGDKALKQSKPEKRDKFRPEKEEGSASVICGRNPVIEALKSGRSLNKVIAASGSEHYFLAQIKELCKERKIPFQLAERSRLDAIAKDNHGVVAYASPYDYVEIADILEVAANRNEPPFILILAEVEDPHNLGAIMRTAECAGVHGLIIAKHGAVPMTETVVRVAAGAAEYLPVARVANLNNEIKELKEAGLWVAGAHMTDAKVCWGADLTGPLAIVMGSEGKGIPPLVAKNCDFMVKIPMHGNITSLNVSASAAVLVYEALRQRTNKA